MSLIPGVLIPVWPGSTVSNDAIYVVTFQVELSLVNTHASLAIYVDSLSLGASVESQWGQEVVTL